MKVWRDVSGECGECGGCGERCRRVCRLPPLFLTYPHPHSDTLFPTSPQPPHPPHTPAVFNLFDQRANFIRGRLSRVGLD